MSTIPQTIRSAKRTRSSQDRWLSWAWSEGLSGVCLDRISDLLWTPAARGRPRLWSFEQIWNALMCVLKEGIRWRFLDRVRGAPPWATVYRYWRTWTLPGHPAGSALDRALRRLHKQLRRALGRGERPVLLVCDGQAVKGTANGRQTGWCSYKSTRGVLRTLLVDTLGIPWVCAVHAASTNERHALVAVADGHRRRLRGIATIVVDRGYRGDVVRDALHRSCPTTTVVVAERHQPGFHVQPQRWIVERTWGWLDGCRRLLKHHERSCAMAQQMVVLAALRLVLIRLAEAEK